MQSDWKSLLKKSLNEAGLPGEALTAPPEGSSAQINMRGLLVNTGGSRRVRCSGSGRLSPRADKGSRKPFAGAAYIEGQEWPTWSRISCFALSSMRSGGSARSTCRR